MSLEPHEELQTLNFNRLLDLIDDIGQESTHIVIEKAAIDLSASLEILLAAAKREDWPKFRSAAHAISGTSALIGAERLGDMANMAQNHCISQNFSVAADIATFMEAEAIACLHKLQRIKITDTMTYDQDVMAAREAETTISQIQHR